MFKKLLKNNFFQNVSCIADENFIKTDRNNYKIVFDETRKIIQDDPIIILSNINTLVNFINPSDHIKSELITCDISSDIESSMIIYTTHPRKTTTMITNNIHAKLGKFVLMKAIIPNLEYEIIYNMRSLIKIYNITRYKNISIPKLFNAIQIDNLYYFPPEIELMDIYHKLYLPNYYDDWSNLLIQEKILYNYFTKTVKNKVGGDGISACKKKRSLSINNIKLLMLKFLDKGNYVLIGEIASKLTNSEDITNTIFTKNIEVITENPIEHDYDNIVKYLSVYTSYGIFYKKVKLYTPKDNRIFKHTFYIKFPSFISNPDRAGIDKQFLDIYNCGEYELIPFIEKKIVISINDNSPIMESTIQSTTEKISLRIGNLFVQLRFLLIDLWLYKILFEHLKIIDRVKFDEMVLYIYSNIKKIYKILPFDFKNKYMGINYDEKIEQKIMLSQINRKKNTYYPELNKKKWNKYKLIATSS